MVLITLRPNKTKTHESRHRLRWLRSAPIVSVQDGERLRGDLRPPGQVIGDEVEEGHRVGATIAPRCLINSVRACCN